MRMRQFQNVIAKQTGLTSSELETRFGQLRMSGIIRKHGGKHDPQDVSVSEAAKVLLAICGAKKGKTADEVVEELSQATYNGVSPNFDDQSKPFSGCETLLSLFEYLIVEGNHSDEVIQVLFYAESRMMEILCANDIRHRYACSEENEEGISFPFIENQTVFSQPVWSMKSEHFFKVHKSLFPFTQEQTKEIKGMLGRGYKALDSS